MFSRLRGGVALAPRSGLAAARRLTAGVRRAGTSPLLAASSRRTFFTSRVSVAAVRARGLRSSNNGRGQRKFFSSSSSSSGSSSFFGGSAAMAAAGALSVAVLYNMLREDDSPSARAANLLAGVQAEEGVTLSPKEFRKCTVKAVTRDSAGHAMVQLNTLPFDDPDASWFVLVRTTVNGKEEVRPYTPINLGSDGGCVLYVKGYKEGKVSKFLNTVQPGDSVEVKGPIPKVPFTWDMYRKVYLVVGGSGVTPAVQLVLKKQAGVKAAGSGATDDHRMVVVVANHTPDDAMAADILASLAGPMVNTYYVFNTGNDQIKPLSHPMIVSEVLGEADAVDYRPGSGTATVQKGLGSVAPVGTFKGLNDVIKVGGHVDRELLEKLLPAEGDREGVMVMVCGPPGMVKAISGSKNKDYTQGEVGGVLKELGFTKDQVYKL